MSSEKCSISMVMCIVSVCFIMMLCLLMSVGLPKPGIQLTDRFAAGLNINQVRLPLRNVLLSCHFQPFVQWQSDMDHI